MRIDAAVHGELLLDVLLREMEVAGAVAKKAAAGWDGDLYTAYRRPDGHVAVVLLTTWDTKTDAREFFGAYAGGLPAKYPGGVPQANDVDTVWLDCDSLGQTAARLRGHEVISVEGFDRETTTAVLAAVSAAPIEYVE